MLARGVLERSAMSNEGINKVLLLGNLGSEPELRMTPGGQPLLTFRMATTEVYYDKEKVKQERTEWHTVTLWGKRGESLARYLSKGSRVFVEGRIHNSSYEKDGVKRYKSEVVALDLKFAGGARRDRDPESEIGPLDTPSNGAFSRPSLPASIPTSELPF